ncbi:glycosyltransferase [Rivularia sp. PCC 7116]|uniref:glycosyltransferase family 4 protein n=1 Tax=Rivularia sp. PCC 7116 TaxID=373994 RepID=UPI00029F1FBD|nr:glycosyltransferase family 4 protein [Rivularia sp. PCC 7116]AFY55938.1 glycosyltransferase [Rivularia sp. PCC 7116]
MRLLIIDYAGDFREAYHKIHKHGIETYHSHKYVIDTASKISQQIDEVTLACCNSKQVYNEKIEPNLRVIAGGFEPYQNPNKVLEILESQQPTHLVVRFPMKDILLWGIKHQAKIMALFADSFISVDWKTRIQNYTFKKILNHQQIDWVANHGLNASYSLQKIGVNPDKIIPWDFPHQITPRTFNVKKLKSSFSPKKLVYVGSIRDDKGVGDILTAIAKLRHTQAINLKIAGSGEIEKFQHRAKELQISKQVEFLGQIPQKRVIELMCDADAVVVPSWHEYPEACPFTIYESLCTHTPIIASDHPMFRGNLIHRQNAMIFPERKPKLLAQSIQELFSSEELYHRISLNSEASWEHLQMPVKWRELITSWLFDSPVNQKWLSDRSLSSGLYNQPKLKSCVLS